MVSFRFLQYDASNYLRLVRARRKVATEKDFLDAVHKVDQLFFSKCIKQDISLHKILFQVIKSYAKFSATPKYMTYN